MSGGRRGGRPRATLSTGRIDKGSVRPGDMKPRRAAASRSRPVRAKAGSAKNTGSGSSMFKFVGWADTWAKAHNATANERGAFLRDLRAVPELREYSRKDVKRFLRSVRSVEELMARARPYRQQRLAGSTARGASRSRPLRVRHNPGGDLGPEAVAHRPPAGTAAASRPGRADPRWRPAASRRTAPGRSRGVFRNVHGRRCSSGSRFRLVRPVIARSRSTGSAAALDRASGTGVSVAG